MYVRLGFAVAINVDPEILLIDEVLAVGDQSFQLRCNEKFAEIRNSGRTMVLVTHDLSSVRALCDRALWLQYGTMRELALPTDVTDAYLDETAVDREGGAGAETRGGSGEIRVISAEWLAATGEPVQTVRTGDDVTLRLSYSANAAVREPVITLEIHSLSGIVVTSPSNRDAGVVPPLLDGDGHVDVRFTGFGLLPGTYDIAVRVRDYSQLHLYDWSRHLLRFEVMRGRPSEEGGGLVTLRPSWTMS
jgi:energy-coupling factor transporter ATP-binding protein EcfA2